MNKKELELMEELYFEKGLDEVAYLDMLRRGHPRWVEKIMSLFYDEKKDYLKKWGMDKGTYLSGKIHLMMREGKRK